MRPEPDDAVDRAERQLAEHRAERTRRASARSAEGPRAGRCDCDDLEDHGGDLAVARCPDPDCAFAARRCERHGGDLAVRAVVGNHHRQKQPAPASEAPEAGGRRRQLPHPWRCDTSPRRNRAT